MRGREKFSQQELFNLCAQGNDPNRDLHRSEWNLVWGQLSDDLEAIIAKHRNYFDGEPLLPNDVETKSETEREV